MSQTECQITILVEDEKTFLLPAVERTVRTLSESGFRVTHLGIVPPKLARLRGWRIPLWYLRVFGLWNTTLLAAFAALERWRRQRAGRGAEWISRSWRELAEKSGVATLRFLPAPNEPESIAFLRASNCDILLIMVPYVLGPEVLATPSKGVINKHAAILPGCRGLFPYVWSTILGKPLGVTFHKVVARIDAGPILVQRRVVESGQPRSMVEFYIWVFRQFPEMASEAVRRLCSLNEEPAHSETREDYFSLPTRADYKRFHRAGGRIICLRDLRRSLVL